MSSHRPPRLPAVLHSAFIKSSVTHIPQSFPQRGATTMPRHAISGPIEGTVSYAKHASNQCSLYCQTSRSGPRRRPAGTRGHGAVIQDSLRVMHADLEIVSVLAEAFAANLSLHLATSCTYLRIDSMQSSGPSRVLASLCQT